MTTTRDIIARAHKKIGVSGVDEAMTADEAALGLENINMMMHEWKLRGVDIEHVTLDFDDDFPLGPEYELGTVYLLAANLSHDYEIPRTFDADDFFRAVQAAYMTIGEVTIATALQDVPSRLARSN